MSPHARAALRWVKAEAQGERRRATLSPTGWLVLSVALAFTVGIGLLSLTYWVGYEAGYRAADEDAVYRAVGDAVRLGVRVALRSDSVAREHQAVAAKAAQQLPPRMLDSLRNVRWMTPPKKEHGP